MILGEHHPDAQHAGVIGRATWLVLLCGVTAATAPAFSAVEADVEFKDVTSQAKINFTHVHGGSGT